MLIGVTGGIGCGKSHVAKLLSELLPAPYFSSDEICREQLKKNQPGYTEFVRRFGEHFLDSFGTIDRKKLRRHIFSDDENRRKLESILHPLVRKQIMSGYDEFKSNSPVVAEVPLLFECGWEHDFDVIICVVASEETVIERIMTRDQVDREDAERIISVQMDLAEKADRSDFTIDNSGDMSRTRHQIAESADLLRKQFENG